MREDAHLLNPHTQDEPSLFLVIIRSFVRLVLAPNGLEWIPIFICRFQVTD